MAGGTIDADKIDAYIVNHPSGARALLAPSRPDQASSVTPPLLQEIYTALRPGRSTPDELEAWVQRLESALGAPRVAAFVREAHEAYEARGLFARGTS